jgi:uncharacterized protein YndB with AHSA1/START domain
LSLSLITLFIPHDMGKAVNDQRERAIRLEIRVAAPVKKVWDAWTTPAGIKSFFGKDCHIELRVLGPYEIFFNPTGPRGRRGAEDNFILAIQEGKMLAFTWDAPWSFPAIRQQRTSVVLRFSEIAPNQTLVTLTHSGWGEGEEWDKVYNYFVSAWGETVLPYLKHSLEVGPIDWNDPPRKVEKASLIE